MLLNNIKSIATITNLLLKNSTIKVKEFRTDEWWKKEFINIPIYMSTNL